MTSRCRDSRSAAAPGRDAARGIASVPTGMTAGADAPAATRATADATALAPTSSPAATPAATATPAAATAARQRRACGQDKSHDCRDQSTKNHGGTSRRSGMKGHDSVDRDGSIAAR